MALIKGSHALDEEAFIVGTEGGLVYRCLIKKPGDEDIGHLLTASHGITWSEEAR